MAPRCYGIYRAPATAVRTYVHALPLYDEDVADYLADLYGLTDDTW